MTIATTKHVLVKCRPCGRVWSLSTLPIEISAATRLMTESRCPGCGSTAKQHFMATDADAALWAQEQAVAAAGGQA